MMAMMTPSLLRVGAGRRYRVGGRGRACPKEKKKKREKKKNGEEKKVVVASYGA
jgi:hypothetical protein